MLNYERLYRLLCVDKCVEGDLTSFNALIKEDIFYLILERHEWELFCESNSSLLLFNFWLKTKKFDKNILRMKCTRRSWIVS